MSHDFTRNERLYAKSSTGYRKFALKFFATHFFLEQFNESIVNDKKKVLLVEIIIIKTSPSSEVLLFSAIFR